MKILQLCPRVPFPPADGGSIAMVSMLESLEANGCRMKMMCYNTSKHPVSIDDLEPTLVKRIGLRAIPLDNHVKPIEALRHLIQNSSYHLSRFRNVEFRRQLENLLQKENFDAFILESIYMHEAIPIIRKHSPSPVVLRAHNVEHAIWKGLALTVKNPLKKWYLGRLAEQLTQEEERILSEVDGVLAITEEDACAIRSQVPDVPVLVSPTGIVVDKYNCNPTPDPLLVAHIGAMDWQPNVEGIHWFLDKVWPIVTEAIPGARLKLAGKNMPAALMKSGSSNVSVQGFVKFADEFLADAGIVVIPLLNGSGMRIKILEGMAMGKAIVTTPVGCEGIPVSDGENILIAETADSFAKALAGLLLDPAKQKRLGKAGRELVFRKFNTAGIGREAVLFVEKLAQNHGKA